MTLACLRQKYLKRYSLFFCLPPALVFFTGCINMVTMILTPPSESMQNLHEITLYELNGPSLSVTGSKKKNILLLPIEGEIQGEMEPGGGVVYPGRIQRMLELASEDRNIDAILLKVSSPGGSASASDTVYRMIRRFARDRNIPVYVHVEGMCASGGYYIAMAGQKINAAPVSLVGSIGVIIRTFGVQGLMEKVGVEYRSISSGKNKDILSPFRDLSEEQKASLQKQIEQNYETFLSVIRTGRGGRLPDAVLRRIADGNIYNAEQAMEYGLIDSIQPIEEYIAVLRGELRTSELRVFSYLPEGRKDYNIYNTSMPSIASPEVRMLRIIKGGVYYLWEGGL